MGSGSSRSSRSSRTLRRQRSPDSHPARPGQAAPEGGAATTTATVAEAPGAGATAAQEAAGHDPGPAATPDGREETLRLLDQLLAESAAWGPQEPVPRGAARPRPAVSPEPQAEDHPEDSHTSEAPSSSHKRPERQSAISYDYAEEELMASIEREYCR
ncbi:cystin-1 isoform X2 [Callospermophilus lateralis]|uniref:cystin-1 isoform X2 n=1 Tax=Callospermophilus lateralis TaxID=76772 RepID=UPI004053C49A